MGLLNILGYIGVGLVSTAILMGIIYAMSRPKETILLGEGENMNVIKQRGEGSWIVAVFFLTIIMAVIATLLFFNLANFSIFKSIGLGVLSAIVLGILVAIISIAFYYLAVRSKTKKDEDENWCFIASFIISLLNGTGIAVLIAAWGWF